MQLKDGHDERNLIWNIKEDIKINYISLQWGFMEEQGR